MNFVSSQFFIFLIVVLVIYWQLSRRHQNIFLLVASWFFYACWDWRFLSLIILATLSNYYCGGKIYRSDDKNKQKIWLAIAIVFNIGLLAYFKYANFFIDSFSHLSSSLGFSLSQTTLSITLPVGISFYIFQSISYSLDIYRKDLDAKYSLLDFATFVGFFPQLVAGPIVRAKEFLYQLEQPRTFEVKAFELGVIIFFVGFFKKAFIADNLAIYLVDPVFSDPTAYATLTLWIAMLGYAVQIYADFSGYSSMAIGCALMMGFYLPQNFNYPYLATNFSNFWQRWHMTMSRFFRDYVYISLGGNRGSKARVLFNLMATTLTSGLWHGANWTFVAWGGLHGIYTGANQLVAGVARKVIPAAIYVLLAWLVTQLLVCLAWVLFRSSDFAMASDYLSGLFIAQAGNNIELTLSLYLCFLAFLLDHFYGWLGERKEGLTSSLLWAKWIKPVAMVAMLFLVFHGKPEGVAPFIYFQF